jgi:hypothetical protein
MIAILSQAQIKVLNIADNQALAGSPAFVDASSNVTANNNQGWGKGLVFPRVDLSTFTLPAITGGYGKANSFPTYLDGMIVYNTKTGGTAGVGSTDGTLTPGYWYYENKSGTETGGIWKPLGSGTPEATQLTGSASIILDGDKLVRAALAGDVTAPINSNVVTIKDRAINSAKIGLKSVGQEHLASMSATTGQVLAYSGSQWAPTSLTAPAATSGIKFMQCQAGNAAACSVDPGSGWECAIMQSTGSGVYLGPWGIAKTCGPFTGGGKCLFMCVK